MNNDASQLARSRCFFFFCMRESSLGDVFILFRAKKERCRRNLNLPLDQAAFSAIARKMKSMPLEIHLFTGPISSLYRLISNTYSTPLGHPVDRYKKSLRSRHRHPMSPEGHPVGPSPTLIKTLFLSYSFKEKKKKVYDSKSGITHSPERSNTIKLRESMGTTILATDSSPNVDIKSLLFGCISVVSKREEGCV